MGFKKILFFLPLLIFTLNLYSKDKKVLMVIAFENFRDEELQTPKEIFEKNGIKVDIASNKKGTAKGMLGLKVNVELKIDEVEEKEYDGIIFVGGIGSQSLFNNTYAINLAKNFYKNKKVVGAICLAPGILANSGILKGKKATCYPSASDILKKNGAIYTGKEVEVDGNIVTGSGPEAAEKFATEILKLLKK
ncbi:MAG: DJ-1/PfpI/YhbO family deglycase/protease [Candidatus Ratteibacteria bacterium]